jgi:transcriptional regulator with GAF, ATPase, and Fis domain
MKEANLGRVLSGAEAVALVRGIMTATGSPSTVWDAHGGRLLDVADSPHDEMQQKHVVVCASEVVGWVSGGEQAELVAALLSYLVTQESDKEELLDEILGLYREVNLLFDLSGKLAPSLEPETVAGTILREASRLIKATCGAVLVFKDGQIHRLLATMGDGVPPKCPQASGRNVVDAVLLGTRAEIINDLRQDPRYTGGWEPIRSLICAPLTSKNETIGAVVLATQMPVTFIAADLKLLTSLASLAVPSIESALIYERKLKEAQEREELLRRQVQDLRIELDEARQKEKVAEITGSEFYQRLRSRADTLRRIIRDPSAE